MKKELAFTAELDGTIVVKTFQCLYITSPFRKAIKQSSSSFTANVILWPLHNYILRRKATLLVLHFPKATVVVEEYMMTIGILLAFSVGQ
jgi:hypothetical protein